MVTAARKLKTLAPWKKSYDRPRQCVEKQRHRSTVKAVVCLVVTYEYENWTIKKAEGQRIDAFELTLEKSQEKSLEKKRPESPLDCKEIKPMNPKENQS